MCIPSYYRINIIYKKTHHSMKYSSAVTVKGKPKVPVMTCEGGLFGHFGDFGDFGGYQLTLSEVFSTNQSIKHVGSQSYQ